MTKEMMSPYPTSWSPRMLTMTWTSATPEDAAGLARSVADLLRGAAVSWEGLPLWQLRFHVTCRKKGAAAEVGLLLWPEPEAPEGR